MRTTARQSPLAVEQSAHTVNQQPTTWNGEVFMASVGLGHFELRPYSGEALATVVPWIPSGGIRIQAGPGKRIVTMWDATGRLYVIDQFARALLLAHSFQS